MCSKALRDRVFEALYIYLYSQCRVELRLLKRGRICRCLHTSQVIQFTNGKTNFLPTASTSTIGSLGPSSLSSSSNVIYLIFSTNFLLFSLFHSSRFSSSQIVCFRYSAFKPSASFSACENPAPSLFSTKISCSIKNGSMRESTLSTAASTKDPSASVSTVIWEGRLGELQWILALVLMRTSWISRSTPARVSVTRSILTLAKNSVGFDAVGKY